MARVQSFLGDFRAALQNEKSTYSIYNSKARPLFPHGILLCAGVKKLLCVNCLSLSSLAVTMSGLKRAQSV